ncbi:hypothetical protein [Aromatoleum toluclasticum]|uniref:hypothetical protein n=1 Tax=Aromatoleum toluclasticum TaxID=92003 RepID=UPI000360476E|nr:hypothetical protein [Aromatoleum toluclasticum]
MSDVIAADALLVDERVAVPVTAVLSHADAVRLEVLVARWRGVNPAMDENTITDAVFAAGLAAVEQLVATFPEQA